MTRAPLRAGLLAIVLVAFALRVWRLDYQELRGDEAFGYFFSLPSLATITVRTLELQEPHPVASYWLQHGWLALAGDSEYALRFPSVWWGTLAVALMAQLARVLGLAAGVELWGALILAASPYALWHAQDARMYSMSLGLSLAAVVGGLRWAAHQTWKWAMIHVLCAWLALHTHYYAAFVIATLAVYVLVFSLRAKRRDITVGWILLQGATLTLYLPWLLAVFPVLGGYRGNGDSPSLLAALLRTLGVLWTGEAAGLFPLMLAGVLAASLVVAGAYRLAHQGRQGRRALVFLVCYALAPFLATWLAAQSRPIFNERYMVAIMPPLLLLLAVAVQSGWQSLADLSMTMQARREHMLLPLAALLAIIGLVIGLVEYHTNPTLSKTRGWRELAERLERLSVGAPPERVRLVQNYPDPTLWYYYRGEAPHLVLPPEAHDVDAAQREAAQLAGDGVERVVFTAQPDPSWDDQGVAEAALAAHFRQTATLQVSRWSVSLYTQPPQTVGGPEVEYTNGVRLTGAVLASPTSTPQGVLVVHLAWDFAQAQLNGTEKISLQLLHPSGRLVAQTDVPLIAGLGPTGVSTTGAVASYGILLPGTLALGPHRLYLVMYDPAIAGSPRVLTTDGREMVDLFAVEVIRPPGDTLEMSEAAQESYAGAP